MALCNENYNSKVLVEMWGDLINWEKRRRGENGFLKGALRKFHCKDIFDACLGDGADSIHLLENGFNVKSNEFDKTFLNKARQNARSHGVTLNVTRHDWRELKKFIQEESFDAIFCLGNSLTYLFGKKDQLKALRNFHYVLKNGGIFIVDERNYQPMLDNREEILKKGKFQYSGKHVYCGDHVHGKPIKISNRKIHFEYTDERNGNKGYLVMYPFKRGELLNLLKESGFKKIESYSDYKKGFNPKADFYQYICRR